MRAVGMRVRAELRHRWRASVGLALIIGIFGGVVVTAVVGGMRAASAGQRLYEATRFPDIGWPPKEYGPSDVTFAQARRAPQVLASAELLGVGASVERDGEVVDLGVLAASDPVIGTVIARQHVIEGRAANQLRATEAVINVHARDELGIGVGDELTLRIAPPDLDLRGPLPKDPVEARVRVVGVETSPSDFVSSAGRSLMLTRGFLDRYAVGSVAFGQIRLRHGLDDVPAFDAAMDALADDAHLLYARGETILEQVDRSFRLQAVALWLFAGILGLFALAIFGQSIARQAWLEAADNPSLRALGMTPQQFVMLGVARAAGVGAAASALALAIATVLSPLAPIGSARLAETDPGLWFPAGVMLGSAAVLLVAVVALAIPPAMRIARATAHAARGRPSRVWRALVLMGTRPAPSIGARFALDAGRGGNAAPVRSTIAGSSIGIVAFVVAIVVAASLAHLLATPELSGFTWDAQLDPDDIDVRVTFEPGSDARRALEGMPFIDAVTYGGGGQAGLAVNGVTQDVIAIGSTYGGGIEPAIIEGRAPRTDREVALGPRLVRRLQVAIGVDVAINLSGYKARTRYLVVGAAVLPFASDTAAAGEGVLLTVDGMRALATDFPPEDGALIRFRPGTDTAAANRTLRNRWGDGSVIEAVTPPDLIDFGRVDSMPNVLGGVLAALAAATLVHGLVQSTRRRRRDLAVLKTMGFVRKQVRSVVAWQASIITLIAVGVGVPLGIALGRWLWHGFASRAGFVPEPAVPGFTIVIMVPAAILLANVAAAFPARAAARTKPALVLRAE